MTKNKGNDNWWQELPKEIAKVVLERITYLGLNQQNLASAIADDCGLSLFSTEDMIDRATRYGHHLLPGFRERKNAPPRLKRLSTLLYALKVDAKDPLIANIKNHYLMFEYPPKTNPKYDLEKLSDHLKPKDKEWIQNLANGVIASYNKNSKK